MKFLKEEESNTLSDTSSQEISWNKILEFLIHDSLKMEFEVSFEFLKSDYF
jgi:hypothetical protein